MNKFYTTKGLFINFERIFLFIIIILAFFIRLYRINFPLADWHSWRQADTSAVARRFISEGDLLHPRYDDLSSIASGIDNPQGWRFVEFPLYNACHTSLFWLFSFFNFSFLSFEGVGRLVSIFFSLGSLIFLYQIVRQLIDTKTAILSSFFFGFLPFNIFYSRTILPEPTMVFFSLAGIYYFILWIQERKTLLFVVSGVLMTLAILIKPYAVFLLIPLIYYYVLPSVARFFASPRQTWLTLRMTILYILICLIPFLAWRWWISHFPEGVPAFWWLLNSNYIRFKGAFFYWLFGERLGKLILGYWGLPLFVLGLIAKKDKKERWFFDCWFLSILAYLSVFATGNVQHDYYQIITIPIICVFLAKGSIFLISRKINRLICYLLFATCNLLLFSLSWYFIRDYFNINHPEIVRAGQAVDKLVPQGALVIAPYNGDTAFLYQTKRKGWPIGGNLTKRIQQGATFYVSVNFDEEVEELMKKCQVIKKEEEFVIINIRQCDF